MKVKPDAPNGIGLFTYMKGEKWPHEQWEMATGTYSRHMEHLGNCIIQLMEEIPNNHLGWC